MTEHSEAATGGGTGTVFHVCGATHVDLAWKKSRGEHAEMFESHVVQMLDILDQDPDYTYTLEQASHLRALAQARPDLIDRLRHYLSEGRLEMLGGSASLLETNLPSGESLVRNQAIGMAWIKENLGVAVTTGWFIDTFGLHAQTPQILRQFGIARLIANRLGGNVTVDRFRWEGLDGSTVSLVGRDTGSSYVGIDTMVFAFTRDWTGLQSAIASARRLPGDGPYLVMPYTENETWPFRQLGALVREENRDDRQWRFALPRDFFSALEASGKPWPTLGPDLNPEFTGTFSNRAVIRLRNRVSESLLLEAEKWSALAGIDSRNALRDAWWEIAFNHFHDVFTGSCPTHVLDDILATYDRIDRAARSTLDQAFAAVAVRGSRAMGVSTGEVFNGLPWRRTDCLRLSSGAEPVARVLQEGRPVPFERDGEDIVALVSVPPVGTCALAVEHGTDTPETAVPRPTPAASIENDTIRAVCDAETGDFEILRKSGRGAVPAASGIALTAQQDKGGFQTEAPVGDEVPATVGTVRLHHHTDTPLRSRMVLSGEFPALPWLGRESQLAWEMALSLWRGKNRLDVRLTVEWRGEGTRIRLRVPTHVDAAGGLYEVPFGILKRLPYRGRRTARGEWPAQRFAAVENAENGLALVNTGAAGVEVSGGTIWTTLLRAPERDRVGLVPDDTSSQHGRHTFRFALLPYAGTARRVEAITAAQELNTPLLSRLKPQTRPKPNAERSLLTLSPPSVVLSSVKSPDDGTGDEIVIRFYETMGDATSAAVWVASAVEAWISDMTEAKGEQLPVLDERIVVALRPFEIRTIRVQLTERAAFLT